MKNRSILILLLLSASFVSYSQAKQTQLEPSKSLTIEDVNKTSGIPTTMINGKSYSQYKAEQELLKNQQKSNELSPIAKGNKLDMPVQNNSNKTIVPGAADEKGTIIQSKPTVDPVADRTMVKTDPVKPQVPVDMYDAAQRPGTEIKVTKPVMQPNKADRSPEEIEKANQKLLAEQKATPVSNQKTETPSTLVLPAGVKVETITAVEKVTPVEQKVTPGSTDTQAKTKSN